MTQHSILTEYQSITALLHGMEYINLSHRREQAPISVENYNRHIPTTNNSELSKPLSQLINNSKGLIENIIVHGSAGDCSSIPFSDLDATIVISDKITQSHQSLLRLQHYMRKEVLPFLYAYDSSQHHGFFFLWPALCKQYDEAILPPCVYDQAWAINPVSLSIQTKHNSSKGRTIALIKQALNSLENSSSWTKYTYKNLLSHLLILPSVHATEQGSSGLKSNSFDPFIVLFPNYKLIYEFASEQRLNWQHKHKFSATPLHLFAWRILGHKYPKVMAYRFPKHHIETNTLNNIRASLEDILNKSIDK